MGSGMREKKCRWSLSMLFGERLHAGTVAGRDVGCGWLPLYVSVLLVFLNEYRVVFSPDGC